MVYLGGALSQYLLDAAVRTFALLVALPASRVSDHTADHRVPVLCL